MVIAGILTLVITYSLASPGGIYLAPFGLIAGGVYKIMFDPDFD